MAASLPSMAPLRTARMTAPAGRARYHTAAAVGFEGCTAPLAAPIKVVGCGGVCVDYLASVAAFPEPDAKLRTQALEVQGGGNCANALTAAARLGLSPSIVTVIGGDEIGQGMLRELQGDGVDTSLVVKAEGYPSPFTYIIVDQAGGTRTCIHTPGAQLAPDDLDDARIAAALDGAALVYFDGRLTEAALRLAAAARRSGVPVLVEGERLRPGLQDLLALADYVVTSANFPQEWTGEACLGDALLELAARLPVARMIITTRGSKGSVCLLRRPQQDAAGERCLQDLIDDLDSQAAAAKAAVDAAPVCMSASGAAVLRPALASAPAPLALGFSGTRNQVTAAAAARSAAARHAELNADAANAQGYTMVTEAPAGGDQSASSNMVAEVHVAGIAGLPPGAVLDTTGAGDAFIGSVLYGLCTGMTPPGILALAAAVAACKCTAIGARPGLPMRKQLVQELLLL